LVLDHDLVEGCLLLVREEDVWRPDPLDVLGIKLEEVLIEVLKLFDKVVVG
jgi:hypothetical protein